MNKSVINIMKAIFLVIISIILLSAIIIALIYRIEFKVFKPSNTSLDKNEITIMNFNVRCIAPQDTGKKSWFLRANNLVSQIAQNEPDIITFQEVTNIHQKYLQKALPDYDYIIKYRESGYAESTPIYYRKDKFELVDKNGFWLSTTPDVMSKSWGAAFNRICSYVILKEKSTKKEFIIFNTHLDHVSELARVNGINLVLEKITEFGGYPSILTGDMNAKEDSETYKNATEHFLDSKFIAKNSMSSNTYHNWGKINSGSPIDYCFVSKSGIKVNSYKVLNEKFEGIYTSDHYPLVVKIELE